MAIVGTRELRNQTRSLLDRAAAGENVTITVDGRAVAMLVSASGRDRWMPRERFIRQIVSRATDASLSGELRALVTPNDVTG